MPAKKLIVFLLVFLVTCLPLVASAKWGHWSLVTFSYAQDDSGVNDVTGSISEPTNDSSGGSSGISEGSRDSWATDSNFNNANTTESSETGGGLTTGSHDSWATDPNFSVADNVNQAAYAEQQAYQSLYSYEAEHGMDGSAEHQALQQAAAESSAATQNAQAAFDSVNSPQASQANEMGQVQSEMRSDLASLASGQLDLEQVQSQIDQAGSRIPDHFDFGERAAAWGGSGLSPVSAGIFAAQDAENHGGGIGDKMGAFQIAYSTSGGTTVSGNLVTEQAMVGTYNPNVNIPDFINASFSTAQTHGANPAEVLSQLQSLGIDTGKYQEQIISAAVNHGIPPGDVYSAPVAAPAAATEVQEIATTGPNNQEQPAPAPAPMHAPEPVTVQPPVPDTGNTSGSSCPGGVCP